jgi:hypothetical protein
VLRAYEKALADEIAWLRAARDGQGVEERDPGESVVPAAGLREGLQEPAPELSATGGGHAIEIPVRASAGPEDPQDHVTLPSKPGEGGVDLGDFRLPDRFHLLLDHAREVVSGPRLTVEETEKDVRKGHTKTISTLI